MSMPPLRLLIVDDSTDDADLVLREVQRAFDVVEHRRVDAAFAMRESLRSGEWDVAILDFSLPGFGAMEALEIAQNRAPDMPCIIVSGVIDTGAAVEAMRMGVRDYLMKDDLTRLAPAIARELQGAEVRRQGRRAERASRESEDRYRTVVEASQDGIIVSDTERRVIFANQAALEMFGYSLDELRAGDRRELVYADDSGQVEDWRRNMVSSRPTARRYVGRRVRKDGSVFLAEVSVAPLITDGETTGSVVDVRDVTERVEAEGAVRASEEQYRSLVDAIPDLIFRLARDGTYLDFHAGASVPHLPTEELLGKRVADVMPPDLAARTMAVVARALDTGETQSIEYRLDSDDGMTDWESRFAPLSGDEVIAIARDITDQVRLKEQLLQAQKSEALGALVAGVAHDFNNLLTPVLGGIELARLRPAEAERWLANAETAATRASELVQQLLAFSRPSQRQHEPIDATAAAREAVSMAGQTFDRRIQLQLEAADELPPILGDHGELVQVLMNLILNARDAVAERMEAGDDERYVPLIGVTVDATPGSGKAPSELRIIVEDNGVGMSDEVRTRAFDPFFSTKEVGEGTGLGLATAYRIIEDHDGSLALRSVPGVGTTFTIRLPVVSGELPPEGDRDGEPDERTRIGSEHSVLILDDDPMVIDLADAALTDAGCDVVATTDVTDALRAARERTFDLLILDLNMPQMNGWQALERFREADPGLPVLIATGFGSEEEARERGTQGLLPKPYTPGQLVETVTALVSEPPRREGRA